MKQQLYSIHKIIIGVAFIYAICTLLFCLPVSFLQQSKPGKFFLAVFPQRWHFFKDVQPYNPRLWYVFKDSTTQKNIATIEILEPLRKNKYSKAPFNQQEIVLDNIFYYNMYYLPGYIQQLTIQYRQNKKLGLVNVDSTSYIETNLLQTKPYKTLINYGLQNIAPGYKKQGVYMQMKIQQHFFYDAYRQFSHTKNDATLYTSKFYPLP